MNNFGKFSNPLFSVSLFFLPTLTIVVSDAFWFLVVLFLEQEFGLVPADSLLHKIYQMRERIWKLTDRWLLLHEILKYWFVVLKKSIAIINWIHHIDFFFVWVKIKQKKISNICKRYHTLWHFFTNFAKNQHILRFSLIIFSLIANIL